MVPATGAKRFAMTASSSPTDPARLFIAAALPGAVLDALAQARPALSSGRQRTTLPKLRWVHRDRLHLTLKFLGATPVARVEAIDAALQETAAETAPIALQLQGWGLFSGHRPRVVWAGLAGELDRLAGCAARLDARLSGQDVPPDRRPFRPHLTIARVPDRAPNEERVALRVAVEGLTAPAPAPWRVEELHLFRSHLGADAHYETLASHRLARS